MVIIKAVVVIALIAILFYFFGRFIIIGGDSADRETCRTSVLIAAKTNVLGKPIIDELNCKTDYKTIKSDDPNEIKMEITNEMVDCWYQFGEHRKDFIKTLGGKKTFVFVCSRIDFKEGISSKVPIVKDLPEFWATTPVPLKEDITFFDYFYGALPGNFDLELSTEEPIYIAFIGTSYNIMSDLAKEDPRLYLYLAQSNYGAVSVDKTGLGYLLGALLVDKVYTPDFQRALYVGNSGDLLRYLGASVDEEECVSGEIKPCIISDENIHGECAIGEKKCLSTNKWSSECKQIILAENRVESCIDNIDNDCDGFIDCNDQENCPNNMPCAGGVCKNRQCLKI